jgi:hypothetical protein
LTVTKGVERSLRWGALLAAAAACDVGYRVDQDEFCRRRPGAPECAGAPRPGGAAGSEGGAGPGGDSPGGAGGAGGAGGGAAGAGGVGCTPPKAACGGTCVDVASNADHCGACDYACEAGLACSQGACAPKPVVTGVVAPFAFALDAQSVYFVTPVRGPGEALPPAVRKAPRDGGAAAPVFGTLANARARALALVGATLYFGDLDNNGQVLKGAVTGGGINPHVDAAQPAVQQLFAAGGALYWSVLDPNAHLRRAPAQAGAAAVAADELAFQTGRVEALAAGGAGAAATLYWVNRDNSPADNKSGLWRKAGAAAPERLTAQADLGALALGPTGPFVASTEGIGRYDSAAPGGLAQVLGAPAAGGLARGLAVEGERLYWLTAEGGSLALHRAALDGSGARVLGRVAAKGAAYWQRPMGPAQLTVDGGFVYFSDPGTLTGDTRAAPNLQGVTGAADGAIYRLAE